jgi:hypothetical protein
MMAEWREPETGRAGRGRKKGGARLLPRMAPEYAFVDGLPRTEEERLLKL